MKVFKNLLFSAFLFSGCSNEKPEGVWIHEVHEQNRITTTELEFVDGGEFILRISFMQKENTEEIEVMKETGSWTQEEDLLKARTPGRAPIGLKERKDEEWKWRIQDLTTDKMTLVDSRTNTELKLKKK